MPQHAPGCRLTRMGVHDVRLKITDQRPQLLITRPVLAGTNPTNQGRNLDQASTAATSFILQRSFRAIDRPMHQGDIVPIAVLCTTGEDRVLLGSTQNQTRDDVKNSHGRSNTQNSDRTIPARQPIEEPAVRTGAVPPIRSHYVRPADGTSSIVMDTGSTPGKGRWEAGLGQPCADPHCKEPH